MTQHPLDVEALLALHRDTFGAARMEGDGDGDGKSGDGDGKSGDGKSGDGKSGDGDGGKSGDGKPPQWDGEFSPERAAQLVTNLRAEIASLKAKPKGDESYADRLASVEKELAEAKRDALVAKAAQKHKLPDDALELITATTADAIEKQATALAKYAKTPAEELPGKPRPRLTPGTGSDGDGGDDFDAEKVAKAARRR